MQLTIRHTTRYTYDNPVSYALQQGRLVPLNGPSQSVLEWSVEIEGGEKQISFVDHHGNETWLIGVTPGVTEVAVTAKGIVETRDQAGVLGHITSPSPLWHYCQQTRRTEPGRAIRKLSKSLLGNTIEVASLHQLSGAILDKVPWTTGQTFVGTTAEEALTLGAGVCQDHAQIFVSAAREAGIPARYVSGYLMMKDRVEQDASHAWAEAWLEGLGWVGFDVSNGISPDERYVIIARGLDSREAAPLTGLRMGQSAESMIVSLQIQQ